jgi:hypothetical protein
VDVSIDTSLPHPERDPFVATNVSGFQSPTSEKTSVVEILTNLNGFCAPQSQTSNSSFEFQSDNRPQSIMNSSQPNVFTPSVFSTPLTKSLEKSLGYTETTVKPEKLSLAGSSSFHSDQPIPETSLVGNREFEPDFLLWDSVESGGHYHSDQVQQWITEGLESTEPGSGYAEPDERVEPGVFWISPNQPIRIEGKDGYEIIDLSCFKLSQATFQPNQIIISADSQVSYRIEYAQVQTALFAEGEIVDLRVWDSSLIEKG